MASLAAHGSLVQTVGATTAFTGEACTVTTGTTFQLNDATKRILNPAVALIVKDGVTSDPCTAADFLFGKATLTDAPAGAVTMDGSYLPLLSVALVKSFSLKVSATVLDTTAINAAGVKTRTMGLQSADLTLEAVCQRYDDLDSGAGVLTIDGAAVALYGGPMLISILPASGATAFRGWFHLEKLESKGSQDGLLTLSMSLSSYARTGTVGSTSLVVPVSIGWAT